MAGFLALERARVQWFLSVDRADLPADAPSGNTALRSMTIDGKEIEFSEGFADLHTRVYEDVLAGGGLGIGVARTSIELVHRIRTAAIAPPNDCAHPRLRRKR
jgi:UDP-N-acetyl-2-amino-2-deoxyglucuronate dehydrogenase